MALESAFELAIHYVELVPMRKLDRQQVFGPLDSGGSEVGKCRPVGLSDCGISTRERDVFQVRGTLEPPVAADENLSTPDGSVRAVTGAVESESDHLFVCGNGVLDHRRCDVSVMVLNESHPPLLLIRSPLLTLCPAPHLIAGVGVGDQMPRSHLVQITKLFRRGLE